MTVATRRSHRPAPQRRRRDRGEAARRHPGRGRRDGSWGAHRRGDRDDGTTSDRRPPGGSRPAPHRRDQAVVAVGRPDRRRGGGHRRPGASVRGRRRVGHLGPVRAALVRRLGRRPACGAGGGRGPGARQGLRGRGRPAATASGRGCGPRAAARGPASGQSVWRVSWSGPSRSASSRWSRSTTPASSSPRWHRAPGSSGSTTATSGPSMSTSSAPRGSVSSSPTIGSSSPNRASASPRPSRAGGRSGSTVRSSARRWSAPGIPPRRSGHSWLPVPCPPTRPTSHAGRTSRSAASRTVPASWPRSRPEPTPSGSTWSRARRAS